MSQLKEPVPFTPNPVNPLAAISGFDWSRIFDQVLAGPDAVLLARPDPARILLLVWADAASTDWGISPEDDTLGFGIRGIAGSNYILIHSASYPALCQSAWYVSGQTFPLHVRAYSVVLSTGMG